MSQRQAARDVATIGAGHPARSREFVGEVVGIEPIMGDAAILSVDAPMSVVHGLRSGRFFDIACRDDVSFDPLLRRPYSVYRIDPERSRLSFLVRPFGRGSAWLSRRHPGDRLELLGPLGNTYEIEPRSQNALLIAGGVGVAPMVMLADEAIERGLNVTFLMGATTAAGLLPASELPDRVEYVVATDDGSKGYHGYVTDLAADNVRWADQIFACGPESMYQALQTAIAPRRISRRPTVQVSMERDMACGLGACLGCVVETRRGMVASCVQGPVFDLDEIVW
ncbi:MAG TPA: dihydroorotate dehydrogenase electron transfer subunit [Thermomicrobiales bacterium]|nr:dihydroorotate dehydrogenase electron transfer subunit [Thermomicrobiales bacterium]